ncbi:hypothetical protein WI68_25430 [Burkholderia cepacia]|nr:hypothetical protein WI68_25430 [Burkholderia cepacia]
MTFDDEGAYAVSVWTAVANKRFVNLGPLLQVHNGNASFRYVSHVNISAVVPMGDRKPDLMMGQIWIFAFILFGIFFFVRKVG